MTEMLTGASPRTTELLIEAWTGHTDASDVLDDLTPEQAVTKLEGWPYSVAEQVAHMLFWQRQTHQEIETDTALGVPTATVGWPAVKEEDWPRVRDEFLAGLEKSRELARNPDVLSRRFDGESFTVGVLLLSHVTHNSYHLGQVVLMRRLLGAWPPPNGGNTW